MAYSFQVLISRQSLPDLDGLSAILRKAKLPLRLSHPWVWNKDSGWLPLHWRKEESGCEVELEKLSKNEIAAAKKAGYPGFDTAVLITTRGWESFQAGVAFGASLAVASSGYITETEGEYIGPESALKWAKAAIKEADKHIQMEAERNEALTQAQAAGNIQEEFIRLLGTLSGGNVKQIHFMLNRLAVVLVNGQYISGSAWCIIALDGSRYAHDRYARLRTKQINLMASSNESPTAEQENALAVLDMELETASALDEKEASEAIKEAQGWPEKIQIVSVTWDRPNQIKVAFDNGASCLFTEAFLEK